MGDYVAVIPARGGSKRLPRKNIRPFLGKPILAYSIETAMVSGLFDRIMVSTEDAEIGRIAEEHGALWLPRPAALADDQTSTQAVMHDIARHGHLHPAEFACVIYATAPLMAWTDLHRGLDALRAAPREIGYAQAWCGDHDPGQWYWGRLWDWCAGTPMDDAHRFKIEIDLARDCDINTIDDWQRAERMYLALHP